MDLEIKEIYGTAIPIRGNEIDTDRVVPARFLKEVTFDNMGEYLFADAREDPDHALNNPAYKGARIMIVGRNFGGGSSREHAPQAIMRYGIQAIVGDSFAEIFAGNSLALGIPTVTMAPEHLDRLYDKTEQAPDSEYTINLESMTMSYNGVSIPISMPEASREALLTGKWDALSLLMSNPDRIKEVERNLPY